MDTDTALIILPDTRTHTLPVLERRVSVLAEPIGGLTTHYALPHER